MRRAFFSRARLLLTSQRHHGLHHLRPRDVDVCDRDRPSARSCRVLIAQAIVVYILLYLDQEVLSELTNDMGGRAYRVSPILAWPSSDPSQARTYALALQQQRQAAEYGNCSEKPGHRRTQSYAGTQTARPYSGADERVASRAIPAEMAYNRPPSMSERSEGPMMARSAREEAAWDRSMRDV